MKAMERIAVLRAMASLLRNTQHSLTVDDLEGVAYIIEHIAEVLSRENEG